MSDYRRPVDELPVKDEGTISLTDTLIGVDAVAEPAAFQAQLGEIAARLVGPDSPAHISEIISNPNGSYFRVGDFQVAWHEVRAQHNGNNRNLQGSWGYPAPFLGAPFMPAPPLPTSGSKYSSSPPLNLNNLGHPFTAVGPGSSTASVYVWENSSPFVAGQWVDLQVIAIGRWR